MESDNFVYSLQFVIDKSQATVVKTAEERIHFLFNVKIKLEGAFTGTPQPRQWVYVAGTVDGANKAKEYILALTSPAEVIRVKNVGRHPLFTSQKEDEIERCSCAALSKCEDGDLMIRGTELSVMLAQSMIDDMFSKTKVDITDKEMNREGSRSKNLDPKTDMLLAERDFSVKDCDRYELRGSASLNKNNSSLTSVVPQALSTSAGAAAHYTDGILTSDLPLSAQNNMRTFTKQPPTQRKLFPHEILGNSMYASASAIYPRNSDAQIIESTGPHFFSNGGASQAKNVFHQVTHSGDGARSTACYFPAVPRQLRLIGENPAEVYSHDSLSRTGSTHLSPPAKDQQVYLRNLGLSLHYSNEDVQKGLASYSMDDVVRPCDFLETLNRIKAQRHGGGHENMATDLREVPSSSHRPATQAASSSTAARKAASTEGSMQDYSVINRQSFIDGVGASSNTVATTQAELSKMPEQDYCDMDESVIYIGTANNDPIVLSSDDEYEKLEEPRLTFPVAPDYPPATHKHQAPVSSEPTVRREPPVCSNRDMTMDRDSIMEEEIGELPERQTGNRNLRYIIIDGSNVAMAHGDNKVYFVKGLAICINYFVKRGHDRVTAFVPEWRRYSENQAQITGRTLLEKLHKDGFIKFTPARRVNGKTIACYDDRFILNLAEKEDGVIVSNDQFRDLCRERDSYKTIVANCLLQFMFVGDHCMPPDDPLGRHGPHLNEFLRCHEQRPMPNHNGRESPPGNLEEWVMVDQIQPNQRLPTRKDFDHDTNQPVRKPAVTSELFDKLAQMFPEPSQTRQIAQVLDNHKRETDLNRLTNYCMNALFIK